MKGQQTYKINGQKVDFDFDNYNSKGLGFSRSLTPQVNLHAFEQILPLLRKNVNISKQNISVKKLIPTHGQSNFQEILLNIAKNPTLKSEDKTFVVSKSYHIVDGHSRHIHSLLAEPNTEVSVYVIDLETELLLELFSIFSNYLQRTTPLYKIHLKEFEIINKSKRVQTIFERGKKNPIVESKVPETLKQQEKAKSAVSEMVKEMNKKSSDEPKQVKEVKEEPLTASMKVLEATPKEWIFTVNRNKAGFIETVNAKAI